MNEIDNAMQSIAAGSLNLAHNLNHAEFVLGVRKNIITYKIIGNEYDLLDKNGLQKRIFNFWVGFYWLSPLIAIPIAAYHFDNWWLLFGIVFSYIGSVSSPMNLAVYPVLFCIGEAIAGHWHLKDYDDFFILSMFWGYFWYKVADQYQHDAAVNRLMSTPELYDLAVKKNKIIVTKKLN